MKKKLCATFLTLLALMVFATSVFAAEARWRNVTKITPIILASTNTYSSVINGSEGTTKIDCTLILYEKNPSGTYDAPKCQYCSFCCLVWMPIVWMQQFHYISIFLGLVPLHV